MRLALVAAVTLATTACAMRPLARTVGGGRTEVVATAGGPLIANLGPPIPIPIAVVGARHGMTDTLDLDANVHVTAAAYGVAGVDVGVSRQLFANRRAAIAIAPRLEVFTDGSAVRAYPELGVFGDVRLGSCTALVWSVSALAQLTPPSGKPVVLVAPGAGLERALGAHTLAIGAAWISPWQRSTSVIDYVPGSSGALAIYLGWRMRLGGS